MLPEKAQNLLKILFVSVNLTDIALVQPIRIGISWLGIWKFCVGPQIVRTLEHVRMRSKLLLLRSSGVVRDANIYTRRAGFPGIAYFVYTFLKLKC